MTERQGVSVRRRVGETIGGGPDASRCPNPCQRSGVWVGRDWWPLGLQSREGDREREQTSALQRASAPSPLASSSLCSQLSAHRTTPAAGTARIGLGVVQSCSESTAGLERSARGGLSRLALMTEKAGGAGEVGNDGEQTHSSAAARASFRIDTKGALEQLSPGACARSSETDRTSASGLTVMTR